MRLDFKGKKITGVVSILPEKEYVFEDEVLNPDDVKAKRLKRIIGYGKRRRVKAETTMSDLILYGLHYMIDCGYISRDEIGAVIVSTLCPDYFLPQISSIIHGEMELPKDVYCLDIPQACSGYVMGLIHAFMLLEHMTDRKVILCTGEIFNRKSNMDEPKLDHPSFGGDIANISVIENTKEDLPIYTNVYNDGAYYDSLIIRYGGFRNPMTPEMINQMTSNCPCSGVEMDGSDVFNFAQREVPDAVFEVLKAAGKTKEDVDYYLFHQPNKFMLQKLADKLDVPYEKMPNDITETLGNSDSGTIPAVMTTDVADELMSRDNLCCIAGFGAGLTWTTVLMRLLPLSFCENINSNL